MLLLVPYVVHACPAASPPVFSAVFTSGMFAVVTAFCRASAAALHVRPSAVHCELQLTPTGAFVHFINSCIVVCAFAVPAHHVIVIANASPGCIVCAFAGPANAVAVAATRANPKWRLSFLQRAGYVCVNFFVTRIREKVRARS